MNVEELHNPGDYLKTPQIERNTVKLLWHSDFWDGPLDGMLLYNGLHYWYKCCAEGKEDFYRRFLIIRLSDEQIQEEQYWNELFRQKVGTHWDYVDGVGVGGDVKPQETHAEFYDAYKQRKLPDLSHNQVVGWFEI